MKRITITVLLVIISLSTWHIAWAEWRPLRDGQGKDIAIDGLGRVWVIGMDNRIYFYNGSAWQLYPGNGAGLAVSVSRDGTPFIIGMDNRIYRGTGNGWVEIPGNGMGKDIAIDGLGRVWVIGMDDHLFKHNGNFWGGRYIPAGVKLATSLSQDSPPLVIGMNGLIYRVLEDRITGQIGISSQIGNMQARDIAIDGQNRAWIIGMDSKIYFLTSDGRDWQQYPGDFTGLAISAFQDGTISVIGMDNRIFITIAEIGLMIAMKEIDIIKENLLPAQKKALEIYIVEQLKDIKENSIKAALIDILSDPKRKEALLPLIAPDIDSLKGEIEKLRRELETVKATKK